MAPKPGEEDAPARATQPARADEAASTKDQHQHSPAGSPEQAAAKQGAAAAADVAREAVTLCVQRTHVLPMTSRQLVLLSSTSKAMAALVAQHAGGQLHVVAQPATPEAAAGFAAWLRRNHALLRTLEFGPRLPSTPTAPDSSAPADNAAASAAVAAALAAAAAGRGLRQLRAFTCWVPDAVSADLLAALPAGLTRLALAYDIEAQAARDDCSSTFWSRREAYTAPLRACLARVTGLRSLALDIRLNELYEGYQLLDCLRDLPHLECFDAPGITLGEADGIATSLVGGLPPSLRRLRVAANCAGWDFSHLTALTRLDMSGFGGVTKDDVLPPGLVRLAYDVESTRPLLRAASLRRIERGVDASMLVRLAGLTGLDSVELAHDVCAEAGADGGLGAAIALVRTQAPAMFGAALRGLSLWGSRVPEVNDAAVAALAQLPRGIESVCLSDLCLSASALQRLPAVLGSLPALTHLSLDGVLGAGAADTPEGLACLSGVAGLAALRSLRLCAVPLNEALVAALATGTQLTSLVLATCGCGSEALPLEPLAAALAPMRALCLA